MMVRSIKVQDYSSGKEYVYGDKSGSWQSIIAVNGKVNAGPQTGPGNAGTYEKKQTDSSAFKAPSNSGWTSSTDKSKPPSTSGSYSSPSSGANTGQPARIINSSFPSSDSPPSSGF